MIFSLLFLGLSLVFLEFYLPGAVAASLGAILLLSSLFLTCKSSTPLFSLGYFIFILLSICLVIYIALKSIQAKRNALYLEADQQGYVACSYEQNLIGEEGSALTDLKPSGHIEIAGKRYQALSEIGYVVKGSAILVVGGRGANLIIKKKETT